MRSLFAAASACALITMASAHHSDAGIDMESIVALEGVVTEYRLRNPHAYIAIDVPTDGAEVSWQLQMGTANGLMRRGWRPDTLALGDRVTVRAHAADDGRPYAIIESIDKDGGLGLTSPAGAEPVNARASSLTGVWQADASKLAVYPGGFDGYFHAELELTDRARAAQAVYDPLSDENPESTCIGRPTPAAIISSRLYLYEIEIDEPAEQVIISSEYFDEVRTVYMDGREHPPADQRFATGHSIGWWEGDTLVVDTTNFTDHRSPYQIGVPSGPQKHVVERYRLIEDGARIVLDFTLEDPDYLAEPLVHSRELIYMAGSERFRFDCDPDSTSRFVVG